MCSQTCVVENNFDIVEMVNILLLFTATGYLFLRAFLTVYNLKTNGLTWILDYMSRIRLRINNMYGEKQCTEYQHCPCSVIILNSIVCNSMTCIILNYMLQNA